MCPTSAKLDAFAFLLDLTDANLHLRCRCMSGLRQVPRRHRPQSYDLIDAVFIIHILLHSSMSQMSATAAGHLASWSLGPSLTSAIQCSRSIGTTRLYLTFTLPSTTASELHTCAPQAKRHAAQPNSRHGKFTDSTQDASHVDNHSSQPNHKGTYQPCVRTVALVERIVVLQHVQI